MSDNIPLEIQELILKQVLPVQSLLRFRSVSKQWKSLIDSSEFITHHHNINQTHHLLVRYNVGEDYKFVSIVDDDSFPQHKFSPALPPGLELVGYESTLDSSYGLVGFYGFYFDNNMVEKYQFVIWNPSVRKYVSVMLPVNDIAAISFGVCPDTYDIKIVKITDDLKVDVFALSTGAWRSVSVNPGLRLGFCCLPKTVVINGVIYWTTFNVNTGSDDLVTSFNLTSEELGQVSLPGDLLGCPDLAIYKPKESLALLYNRYYVCDVWMMIKTNDSNFSFEKLFTYAYDSAFCQMIGFRMNGQPIIIQQDDDNDAEKVAGSTLKVYDPSSQHVNALEIDVNAVYDEFSIMTLYTESLLMLNQTATIF